VPRWASRYGLRPARLAHCLQHSNKEIAEPGQPLHLSTADPTKVGFHPWLNIQSARRLKFGSARTVEGIERVGEIAATPGIDAVQIGSADLTASLGLPGEFGHPKVQAAYQQVAAACQFNHKPFIIAGIRKTEDLLPYVAMGAARCYFTGSDSGFLLEGAHAGKARAMAADDSVQRRPRERS
jgi:HpcH/HpaI aldolase/citrate lyase family